MNAVSEATRAAIVAARTPTAAAIGKWREGAAFRAASAAFADCADAPERAAKAAERLLADSAWAADLLAPLLKALAQDPFFEPPFKVHRDPLRTGAVLFDCPAASIAASVTSAAAMAVRPPATIVFTGRIAVTRTVRAGGARLLRWRTTAMGAEYRAANAPPCTPMAWMALRDGSVHRTDGRTHAQLVSAAETDVVTIVATIRAGAAPLMREYDIASGALVRVASADDRPSRTEMLLRFLRAAGRADAGTCFADATRAPEFHLRWAAMREWLALDAHAAMPRLAEMACGDPDPEVQRAAARMLPIVETRLAEVLCPA
jgi:hypothetical protein